MKRIFSEIIGRIQNFLRATSHRMSCSKYSKTVLFCRELTQQAMKLYPRTRTISGAVLDPMWPKHRPPPVWRSGASQSYPDPENNARRRPSAGPPPPIRPPRTCAAPCRQNPLLATGWRRRQPMSGTVRTTAESGADGRAATLDDALGLRVNGCGVAEIPSLVHKVIFPPATV